MMQTICWQADAPSNIALIKYMGKQDEEKNIPSNPSLSYTLNHLQSRVRLILTHAEKMPPINIQNSTEKTIKRKIEQSMDHWQVLKVPGFNHELHLSNFAINRYLKHLKRIKSHYNLTMPFQVFSNNNFPQACGLASSAASFAALTKAAVSACSDLTDQKTDLQTQAQLSRLGSGSSCRSFMGPFVLLGKYNHSHC